MQNWVSLDDFFGWGIREIVPKQGKLVCYRSLKGSKLENPRSHVWSYPPAEFSPLWASVSSPKKQGQIWIFFFSHKPQNVSYLNIVGTETEEISKTKNFTSSTLQTVLTEHSENKHGQSISQNYETQSQQRSDPAKFNSSL